MDTGYEGQRLHISEGKGGVPGAGTSGDRSGAGRIPDAFSSQESKAKEDQNRMIHQNQERAIRSIIRVRSSLLERQRIQLFLQWASFARQQQAVARLSETTQETMQRREESFQQSLAELQGRWDASKQEAESQLRELQSGGRPGVASPRDAGDPESPGVAARVRPPARVRSVDAAGAGGFTDERDGDAEGTGRSSRVEGEL